MARPSATTLAWAGSLAAGEMILAWRYWSALQFYLGSSRYVVEAWVLPAGGLLVLLMGVAWLSSMRKPAFPLARSALVGLSWGGCTVVAGMLLLATLTGGRFTVLPYPLLLTGFVAAIVWALTATAATAGHHARGAALGTACCAAVVLALRLPLFAGRNLQGFLGVAPWQYLVLAGVTWMALTAGLFVMAWRLMPRSRMAASGALLLALGLSGVTGLAWSLTFGFLAPQLRIVLVATLSSAAPILAGCACLSLAFGLPRSDTEPVAGNAAPVDSAPA
ncbi:MAG: hypothetical protein ACYDBQ_08520 [Thermoplasmatota archaeon]